MPRGSRDSAPYEEARDAALALGADGRRPHALRRAAARTAAVGLVLALLGGGAVASWRLLVEPDPVSTAVPAAGGPGCGPRGPAAALAGVAPAPPARVTVQVWNSTRSSGLAGRTAEELAARGFRLAGPAGDDTGRDDRPGTSAELRYGRGGRPAAAALLAQVPGAVPVLDRRARGVVHLVLHEGFDGLRSSADALGVARELAAHAAVPPTARAC
ncbi:LytR C-terminal domain-containing protein [Vallicoccus soli]|uniref:LytR family transcriptional regulator n=1 Tax=Vallicoccus soli TaxID=2339232 RepID=A0A3A3Z3W2_9ACTN|nr:LytR C-terminal domain-containing protein [Vallicoccus soli]RJK97643.1 LytR family transcriptional regulator [Vallicoccus soli]